MGRLVVLASVIFLAIGPRTSFASNWSKFQETDDAKVYMDLDSIAARGSVLKVWSRWDFSKPQQTNSYPPKSFLSSKFLYYVNCAQKTSALIQLVNFTEAGGLGSVVESKSIEVSAAKFTDIVPDSIGETLLIYTCNWYRAQRQSKPKGPSK